MRNIEVSLVEFLDGGEGVRLLGRTNDPKIVAVVRERLARERQADLTRLTSSRPGSEPGRADDSGGRLTLLPDEEPPELD